MSAEPWHTPIILKRRLMQIDASAANDEPAQDGLRADHRLQEEWLRHFWLDMPLTPEARAWADAKAAEASEISIMEGMRV